MFKKLLLASVGFVALATASAMAADMPPSMPMPRAPATYVPFFTWTGFYVGINAGYAWGRSNWTDTVSLVSTGNFNVSGAQAGGTLGYNMQAGNIVFGIETDLDWSGVKGSTTTNCPLTCETKNTWLGTARGRIGYAFDRFLPFIGGGMAYGGLKVTDGAGSASTTKIGWAVGGGVEYAFTGGWSAKTEYIYVDLGKASCNAACSGGNPFDVKFNAHIMRAGLNYKF